MTIDPDEDAALRQIAEALLHPEGGGPYQKAKSEFDYRQMKGQIEAFEQQQLAIEVQRENIAVQRAAIAVQKEALGVQKAAATAEAKAADASVIRCQGSGAKRKVYACVRDCRGNFSYLFRRCYGFSVWSVMHPRQ